MAVSVQFDHRHYVPILRMRDAEMQALGLLTPEDKKRLTPLIELPPVLLVKKNRKGATDKDFFVGLVEDVIIKWGYAPFFMDAELIEEFFKSLGKKHPIVFFADAARNLRLPLVPVTGLRRSPRYQAAIRSTVAQDGHGVCIRLMEDEIHSLSLK